jgi:hypothetical protein
MGDACIMNFLKSKKLGAIEMDMLGKVILAIILLVILLFLIGYFSGSLDSQSDKTDKVLSLIG